ncbi:MAG TPA: site-2 protease family protein [Polyangia bacterium]|nr:site-2 protease family protein [Polyangia bacterium]
MDISPDQLRDALLYLIAFLVSITVHEFGHAYTADKLGDRLPRSQGRVTLSPFAHADLVGTIILPLVGAFSSIPLIAWGKPVQINPRHHTRLGNLLVSVMGPAMNLLLAGVASALIVGLGRAGLMHETFALVLIQFIIGLNIRLMFFNLIPLPPLDGSAVLEYVLPNQLQIVSQTLRRYGMVVLYVLLLSGALGFLMRPVNTLVVAWARLLLRNVPA